uniref:ACB domain-containing protein n=1 Tax=Meleagris gallopavo TaxID=9103 RepID=A0A803XXM5_MELGA
MLKFYSFYKQATQGPCNIPRPGFWDPIGRYKCNLGKGKDSVKSSAVLGKEMLYFSLCSGILSAVLKSLIDCVLCCRTGKVGIF